MNDKHGKKKIIEMFFLNLYNEPQNDLLEPHTN